MTMGVERRKRKVKKKLIHMRRRGKRERLALVGGQMMMTALFSSRAFLMRALGGLL
jgi:hypothetical protein